MAYAQSDLNWKSKKSQSERQELSELRAQYGAQLAAFKAVTPQNATLNTPIQTQRQIEIKTDVQRKLPEAGFDYNSPFFKDGLRAENKGYGEIKETPAHMAELFKQRQQANAQARSELRSPEAIAARQKATADALKKHSR